MLLCNLSLSVFLFVAYGGLCSGKVVVSHAAHPERGTQGVNYDVDESGRPYVWCEKFANHECTESQSDEECTTKVKCFAERPTHNFGCMAVMMYNASAALYNDTLSNTTPNLKSCWSQDATALQECLDDEKCVANARKTGTKDRGAMFCCCRTHNCNHNFTFRPQEEPTTEYSTPQGHSLPVVMLSTKGFNALIVVLVLSSVLALCGLVYWGLRKQRMQYKLGSKSSSNVLSLGSFDKGYESTTLLGNKKENLREITLLEKTASGRFSEVYKGQLSDNLFAVKIFQTSSLESWMNEQDVYALKAVRSHPNVVDFVAAFQNNDKYWLVTVYHKNGSLCDYLKENVVSLEASTKIISTMLEGLAFLHEETIVGEESKPSVVHRDFKSKNVLIKDDLTTCITDFGLALKCENGRMSEDSHGQVGTRRYMAPELVEGATEFSPFAFQQIDVYAAGLVIWEVLYRTKVPEDEENTVPDYLLPYEKEAGPSPSLVQMRDIVVLRQFRPEVRQAHLDNKSSRTIVKTMREMWGKEPDGRITSARARDRMVRLYESLQSGTASPSSREDLEANGDLSA